MKVKNLAIMAILMMLAAPASSEDVDDLAHPSYASNVVQTDNWGFARYGFLDMRAGAAFRSDGNSVAENLALGRWFTPAFGSRLAVGNIGFDGFDKLYGHIDLMYNTAALFSQHGTHWHRWQWVPFAGAGVIRNGSENASYGLAYNYGIDVRCRIARSIFLTLGAEGVTNIGDGSYVDRTTVVPMAGLSFALGKVSNSPRANGMVYMDEKDVENASFVVQESLTEDSVASPVNDYSGLNSLRARLANPGWNGIGEVPDNAGDADKGVPDGIGTAVMNTAPVSSVPVYFFFHLNSDALLVPNQLVNLDDIAQIAIDENRTVSVAGAADAATGSETTNNRLAEKRASYIKNELVKRGVPEDRVEVSVEGGINAKQPKEANRYAVVRLQ